MASPQKMQVHSPIRTIASSKKKKTKTPKHETPLSPLDTYEISDHGGDSDSDDDDSEKQPKRIPTWARKINLLPALEHQFAHAKSCKLDPDEIFGEVQTCDLEAIFNRDRSRYKQRTSSGIWTKDRATSAEKEAYKRSVQHLKSAAAAPA